MIFIIPLILGVAAIAGAIGIAAGAEGKSKKQQAKEIREAAKKRYEYKKAQIKIIEKQTNKIISEYNDMQMQIKRDTVERFIYLLAQIKQKISVTEIEEFLRVFEWTTLPELNQESQIYRYSKAKTENQLLNISVTMGSMVVTAVTALAATFTLASLVGTTSTGTPIGLLSGAAATTATLNWLGGGSLAAGGGGIALGGIVLDSIIIAPALMVGGLKLNAEGKKVLTQATEDEAEVNKALATMDNYEDFLKTFIQWWLNKLKKLLLDLNSLTKQALDDLETAINSGFDPQRDVYKFQKAFFLIKTLLDLISMPVVDSKGNFNPEKIIQMVMLYFSKFGFITVPLTITSERQEGEVQS